MNIMASSSEMLFFFSRYSSKSPPLQYSITTKIYLSDLKLSTKPITLSLLHDLSTLISVLSSYSSFGVYLINDFGIALTATVLLFLSSIA